MKLKYYLRGLGVGIVVTAVILTIANHLGNKMSDEDIICLLYTSDAADD